MTATDPKATFAIFRNYFLATLVLSSLAVAEGTSMKDALNEFFSAQAEQMNESLPAMVDEISRLERVAYSDLAFTHFYTVVGLSDTEFKQEFPAEVLKDFYASNACGHQQSRNAMEDGLTFAYEFRSDSGEMLAELAVTYADCENP